MAYGFEIEDIGGRLFDGNTFGLLSLGEITVTGEQSNYQTTVSLELPPDYDIAVYPFISYRPTDTRVPTYTDHVAWETLSWSYTKDTTGPVYGVTFTINLTYTIIGKKELDSCVSGGSYANLRDNTKTTFQLVASSVF